MRTERHRRTAPMHSIDSLFAVDKTSRRFVDAGEGQDRQDMADQNEKQRRERAQRVLAEEVPTFWERFAVVPDLEGKSVLEIGSASAASALTLRHEVLVSS